MLTVIIFVLKFMLTLINGNYEFQVLPANNIYWPRGYPNHCLSIPDSKLLPMLKVPGLVPRPNLFWVAASLHCPENFGDTPSKKVARFNSWRHTFNFSGKPRMPRHPSWEPLAQTIFQKCGLKTIFHFKVQNRKKFPMIFHFELQPWSPIPQRTRTTATSSSSPAGTCWRRPSTASSSSSTSSLSLSSSELTSVAPPSSSINSQNENAIFKKKNFIMNLGCHLPFQAQSVIFIYPSGAIVITMLTLVVV